MRITAAVLVTLSATVWCGTALAQDDSQLTVDPGPPGLDVDTDLPVGQLLLGSFGLVLVGVGAGFGWQAKQEHDSWQEARDAGDPMGEMDGLADDVKAHSITANVLMFSGAGLAVISVLWLLFGGDDQGDGGEERSAAALWRPQLGPGQAGVTAQF